MAQTETDFAAHTEKSIPGQAATCTKDGLTDGKKCSVCGKILKAQETIPAAHQNVVDMEAKDPTCTEPGQEGGKYCTVCGEILTAQKEIAKTGHTEVSIPGRAATCKQTGLTEGKKCSVCGKELTPQYATPKSTVHKFVPAKDTDPNAGPLDNICSVCGEKQVGLSQGDGAAFVPYEQVDPSSGSNGFTMTTGNDYANEGSAQTLSEEIASGKLQVFKGKDGNDENLLCLVSPDSTMTYLSFEAGTSGVGKVSIASQDNPGGGATTMEPGEGVGQFGIGIGSDKNGKSYLYVEEDGKEVSFTITKEEDEDGRNRVILTTENGSKITIESDSLWYKVQSWDETTELSGSQLEVEKGTTTITSTNKAGESSEAVVIEIVFSVKDLGGSEEQPEETKPEETMPEETKPEETKPKNGIQAINQQKEDAEILEQADNSEPVEIQKVGENSGPAKNYVDIIGDNYVSYWDPENCEKDNHKYVNGYCKGCHRKCTHSDIDVSPIWIVQDGTKHMCVLCGHEDTHYFHRSMLKYGVGFCITCLYECDHPSFEWISDDNCRCQKCGYVFNHYMPNGDAICVRCKSMCTHKNLDKNCRCKQCGLFVHNYTVSSAYYGDSVCSRCKAKCSHTFVADGDNCVCTTCGKTRAHHMKFSATPIPNCVCDYCGKTYEHEYDPAFGFCKRCKNKCDHTCVSVSVGKCQCTKCGYTMSHKWVEGKSGCVCSYCGYELSHLFSFTWGGTTHYVAEYGKTSCTRCGAECKHSYSNCRCTICGAMAKHKWKNGTCTVCGTACEHLGCDYGNTTDCVCSECGMVRKHDWKKKGIFYECTQCGFLTLRKPK